MAIPRRRVESKGRARNGSNRCARVDRYLRPLDALLLAGIRGSADGADKCHSERGGEHQDEQPYFFAPPVRQAKMQEFPSHGKLLLLLLRSKRYYAMTGQSGYCSCRNTSFRLPGGSRCNHLVAKFQTGQPLPDIKT